MAREFENYNRLYFQDFVLVQIFVMTLLFLLTWQFAQFALLLHSLALFGMAILKLLNPDQVRKPFQILTTINSRIGFFSLEISKSSLGK